MQALAFISSTIPALHRLEAPAVWSRRRLGTSDVQPPRQAISSASTVSATYLSTGRSTFQRFCALGLGLLSAASFRAGSRGSGRIVVRGRNFEKNIKKKKGPREAAMAQTTRRHLRNIVLAMKSGTDPSTNKALSRAIKAAYKDGVNKAPIENKLKAVREGKEVTTELRFSGYAQGGAGVIVECLTDNVLRTRPEIKDIFKRAGGEVGAEGCVDHNFNKLGLIKFDEYDEEKILEASMEADVDVEDILTLEDGTVEVTTTPEDCDAIAAAFENGGLEVASSEVVMKPIIEAALSKEATYQLLTLKFWLSEHDDVGDVITNAVLHEGIELKYNAYDLPDSWKNAYGKDGA
eukprot:CAMPEP_0197664936 /NCGR_PEP_ID=MMETSP1338-20131121/58939_1 /TAXON_ID=43686 ORGANISM="Pelagodinium beii, Strain RCC1491" /NCGR_SAMPLE_ID=MMETSP1338 /ASSEMBLY_ACC=CAM_ASM_000754 /LENGTH=348 /DNA_ID=CAMNT_0043243673 /DNA_START=38 /DNA_END=1084 /DNA_ORIENTATION=-